MDETLNITLAERDAILAGLRLLQCSLEKRAGHWPVEPNDDDIGGILTCDGDHAGLDVDGIEALIERELM